MADIAQHDLDILVQVTRLLGETFELDRLLESIAEAGQVALGCERSTVFLYDAESDELYSRVATGADEIRFSARLGIAGEAARTRAVVVVQDAYADDRFNREIDKKTGYRTRNMLTLPLVTPTGEMMGVLQVLNKRDGDFTPRDEEIAGALSAMTSIALKRQMLLDEEAAKQKLEQDLAIAREIQQQLLPSEAPALDGFEIAGWNRPADETGGDLYDYLPLTDKKVGVMIADATGHGIGPALIISQCRAILRTLSTPDADLATIGARVNRHLCNDLPDDRFVTACFGILDAAAARFDYFSAGHGPLLLYRAASDTVEQFGASSLPMGIADELPVEPAEPIHFRHGDIFVLLTDGFMEWTDPDGTLFGEERLCDLIRRHHRAGSAELIDTLYREVLAFGRGTPQLDDLTAIVIKRT